MKPIYGVVLGVVIFMAALWGGAYVFLTIASDTWAEFPTLLTAMLLLWLGATLVVTSINSLTQE